MKLLITGANGFLGKSTVAEARALGHSVRAMLRPASKVPANWANDSEIEVVRADLRRAAGLEACVAGCDAVLHLAADKAGSFYAQMTGSVVATENLLRAMDAAGVTRLIHCSTFSVYDYLAIHSNMTFSEHSAVYTADPVERDDYARTKLIQENLVRQWGEADNHDVTVIRPGVIYGPDNLWNARCGFSAGGNRWIRTGGGARIPLLYVDHCAEAFVLAAQRDDSIGQVINLFDNDPPTQKQYIKLIQKHGGGKRKFVIPVPWLAMRFLAWSAKWTDKILFGGKAKVPGIFIPARLHARIKPLKFVNNRAQEYLGFKPRYTLIEAIQRSGRGEQSLVPAQPEASPAESSMPQQEAEVPADQPEPATTTA